MYYFYARASSKSENEERQLAAFRKFIISERISEKTSFQEDR